MLKEKSSKIGAVSDGLFSAHDDTWKYEIFLVFNRMLMALSLRSLKKYDLKGKWKYLMEVFKDHSLQKVENSSWLRGPFSRKYVSLLSDL